VLTGKVNPSGKLTETFPQRIEDTPSYLSYPGEEGHVRYAEGLFVGYRYYDRKKMKPLFPFGYGLSYTTFEYSNLRVNRTETTEKDTVEVTVTIRNTGNVAGKEIVQLYVRDVESRLVRPEKELKAFAKVALEPGEAKDVTLTLQPRDFAYYDSTYREWVIESGEFELLIGKSSADIVLRTTIQMNAHEPFRPLTITSYIKQIAKYPEALAVVKETLKGTFFADFLDSPFAGEMPFFKLIGFGMPREAVEGLLERINTVLSNR
jgi:beta-glucosidase